MENKPIKYRQFYKGKFHYWGFIDGSFFSPLINFDAPGVDSEEYIGRTDIEGKEIYRGDILEYPNGTIGLVVYSKIDMGFNVRVGWSDGKITKDVKIISNINENPDFLE
jgi:hypothetical protein